MLNHVSCGSPTAGYGLGLIGQLLRKSGVAQTGRRVQFDSKQPRIAELLYRLYQIAGNGRKGTAGAGSAAPSLLVIIQVRTPPTKLMDDLLGVVGKLYRGFAAPTLPRQPSQACVYTHKFYNDNNDYNRYYDHNNVYGAGSCAQNTLAGPLPRSPNIEEDLLRIQKIGKAVCSETQITVPEGCTLQDIKLIMDKQRNLLTEKIKEVIKHHRPEEDIGTYTKAYKPLISRLIDSLCCNDGVKSIQYMMDLVSLQRNLGCLIDDSEMRELIELGHAHHLWMQQSILNLPPKAVPANAAPVASSTTEAVAAPAVSSTTEAAR